MKIQPHEITMRELVEGHEGHVDDGAAMQAPSSLEGDNIWPALTVPCRQGIVSIPAREWSLELRL